MCDWSATKDAINVSSNQTCEIDDCASSGTDEATSETRQLAVAKRVVSPSQFVKISQTDLLELETELARVRNNLLQAAEENKGLLLMQDCHIS